MFYKRPVAKSENTCAKSLFISKGQKINTFSSKTNHLVATTELHYITLNKDVDYS